MLFVNTVPVTPFAWIMHSIIEKMSNTCHLNPSLLRSHMTCEKRQVSENAIRWDKQSTHPNRPAIYLSNEGRCRRQLDGLVL